jgi:peptidoglycan/LPS O-acetylase OafA/YrhL
MAVGDQGGGRVGSLDGLRGFAALGVVVSHTVMASRSWGLGVGSGPWVLSKSPLNILWPGQEWVVISFVLSGYVLALPAVKRSWRWLDAS